MCKLLVPMESKGIMSLRQGQNITRIDRYSKNVKDWIDYSNNKATTFPQCTRIKTHSTYVILNVECRLQRSQHPDG